MKLYLVRHGESAVLGSDNERPLSEQGKKDIQALATFLAPLKLQVTKIMRSEKQRARETADILAKAIHSLDAIEVRAELEPVADISILLSEIEALETDIMLVGHMPYMGKLLAKLLTGNEDKDVAIFKPGTIVCVEQIERSQWAFCWMLTPALFSSN